MPTPSGPRKTGGSCSRSDAPWSGLSPAGWQFTHRGDVRTLPASVNSAAERAAASAMDAKLSGSASVARSAEPRRAAGIRASPTARTRAPTVKALVTAACPSDQIAPGIGEDHGAHGLVVFHVPGATAQVPVESLEDGPVEICARDRCSCQAFQEHLALVDEAG